MTPVSDFLQVQPIPGAAATEKTDVWISFDRENVYVSGRAWETRPYRMVVNEMRRDSNTIFQNESFGVAFDTFYDRRNSVEFNFNAIGGRADGSAHRRRSLASSGNPESRCSRSHGSSCRVTGWNRRVFRRCEAIGRWRTAARSADAACAEHECLGSRAGGRPDVSGALCPGGSRRRRRPIARWRRSAEFPAILRRDSDRLTELGRLPMAISRGFSSAVEQTFFC